MDNERQILSELLEQAILESGDNISLASTLQLSIGELAEAFSEKADLSIEEAKGYLHGFFDVLILLGAVCHKDSEYVLFENKSQRAATLAIIHSIQEGVNNLFNFGSAGEIDNPVYGAWLLNELEMRREILNVERSPSRVQEYVVILVKAMLRGRPVILCQHEGDYGWRKYKLIGGRLDPKDRGNPDIAALREVREEVQFNRRQAKKIRLKPLSPTPLEYSEISRSLGAYTRYKVHVYGCSLVLPVGCLNEEFKGEKGRFTKWMPVEKIDSGNDDFPESYVLDQIKENGWFDLAPVSTNQPIRELRTIQIQDNIFSLFSFEEIKQLCFVLEVDFDELEGTGRRGKSRGLVTYMDMRDRLEVLVEELRRQRPGIQW